MNETGWPGSLSLSLSLSPVDVVAEGRRNRRRSCSSSDNEVAGAVLQNWFFVQDFWPMGQRFSRCCFFELSFGARNPPPPPPPAPEVAFDCSIPRRGVGMEQNREKDGRGALGTVSSYRVISAGGCRCGCICGVPRLFIRP